MFPLSICEIKFWGNWNCEILQLKTFTVLAWFTTFELAVVVMNTSENLDSTWNSDANSPRFRQFKHQKRFRFHSGKFSKGKAILLCESVLWTSWLQTLPLRAYMYLFTFAVHICTKRLIVSVAILSNALISHEPNRYSYKKRKTFWAPSHYLTTDPSPLLPLAKRDCVTKNFETEKETHAAPSVSIKAKHVKNQNP